MWRLLLAGLLVTTAALADGRDIRQLVESGDAAAAYKLALSQLDERAGEPEFDFWYGLAALNSGHSDRAMFAFERVLLLQPAHHRARIELARAYFMQGNLDAAEKAFDEVLAVNPPANVRTRIHDFLQAIERQRDAANWQVSGDASAQLGYDSNINGATSDTSVFIPALGSLSLSGNSVEQEDEFIELAASLSIERRLDKQLSGFVELSLSDRNYLSSNDFDLATLTLQAGPRIRRGKDDVRFPLTYQKMLLDHISYRRMISGGMEWTHQWDAKNQSSVFVQVGGFRYSDTASLDTDLAMLGAAWAHRWSPRLTTVASAYVAADESANQALYEYNGKHYQGVRLAGEYQWAQRHVPYAALTLQSSRYDAVNPVFGALREDDYYNLKLGWLWKPQKQWSVRTELSLSENDSSLSLYRYDRRQLSSEVRYAF